ncbi:hypothetical protein R3P38DRAFT_3098394, partial [Favolaschia claudopus]
MLRPNPSLMMPEQCRLTLVPIRSYHSSHGVLPHTILSFHSSPRIILGSHGSRDFADEPSCITCRCSGLHSHSSGRSNADFSWSSSVHPNTPTKSSRIPSYVSDPSPLFLDSRGSHPTWFYRSSRYSSYSLMLMTPTQPRHWTRRTQGSSGFTSTSLGSIPVHPRVPRMSDLFTRAIRPARPPPARPVIRSIPLSGILHPCGLSSSSSVHSDV